MDAEKFFEVLGAEFYTGVPDSQLKPLCNYLIDQYGRDPMHHIIAANEGNCTALAAGYHLATGKVPVVYMQNSGEGNVINPVASLLNDKVYGIPVIFVIGWRGEPGVKDEPQHIYQGEITLQLLKDMEVESFVVDQTTTVQELQRSMDGFGDILRKGRQVAFVIKKGALVYEGKTVYTNTNRIMREEAIRHIVKTAGEDIIISTTGKTSRELFEIREENKQRHEQDFLTVGSMGHSSSVALSMALQRPERRVWCIDGDGAALMHMGAMALIGANAPGNMVHILLNNEAHETVGGMPTVGDKIDFTGIAGACGYPYAVSVKDFDMLEQELEKVKDRKQLSFVEIKCSLGSRANLGRPTTSPIENKEKFMAYVKEQK